MLKNGKKKSFYYVFFGRPVTLPPPLPAPDKTPPKNNNIKWETGHSWTPIKNPKKSRFYDKLVI